ncbi:MAG TPA: hypothetical protein VGB26_01950 [Nitrospiria bacterium]|jgi:hypothetical protein
MSIPKDQGLTLTVFLSISLFTVFLFWIFLPVHFSKHQEGDEEEVIKVLEPEEAILTVEGILTQVEENIVEKEKEGKEKNPKEKDSQKGGDK